jgi:transitional endoplasmic reticulum ATPase
MAKFKNVPQSFLFTKLMCFWGNMVKNYKNAVQDDDFFAVVRHNFAHDEAVELIETAYSPEEIKAMGECRSRRSRLDLDDSLSDVFTALWNNEKSREKCRVVLRSVRDYIVDGISKVQDEPLERRFAELKRVLKLSDLEYDILLVAYVCNQTCFSWPRRVEDRDKPLFFAMALDRSYGEVLAVMNAKGRLRRFDVLDGDWDFNNRMLGGYLDGVDEQTIERRFYQKNETAEVLPWSFYGELAAKDGEVLKRMLAAKPGKCNILLYGAPGTGKTSFARTLAQETGRTAWEIRQGDDDGRNMKSEARTMGISICNDQEDADDSLMIVDEADELLRSRSFGFGPFGMGFGGGRTTEKGVMNTLLDDMKVPAVWISNAPAYEMDESVRRRFDYSVCFEELNNAQRVSIWRNVVKKHGLGDLVSEAQIADYAAKYATSAGGISTVLDNVKRLAPAKDKVDEAVATFMKPHCKLMGVRDAGRQFLPAKDYSLDGLNIKGKVGLEKIVKAARNYLDADFSAASDDKPRMNILMFGPPGTGKTEFVKYLGRELDRKVVVMKGSDLLSKWVGESEQNIARAFRRAEQERAILFFDEIDGILQSRESASQSWEVSQVNELLQQMENFDGVMVAATNFSKNLDAAAMRRFTFKLEFGYLEDEGKRLFFERMFKTKLADAEFAELKELRNLAPGDFRTVRQEGFYLGEEQTNLDRIAALKEECVLKKDGDHGSKIGF